jgi:hypothetical protein
MRIAWPPLSSLSRRRRYCPLRRVSTIEPTAGTWKSFVISSRSELRAPPPPDPAARAEEVGQLKEIAKRRDPAALNLIAYGDTGAPSLRPLRFRKYDEFAQHLHRTWGICDEQPITEPA